MIQQCPHSSPNRALTGAGVGRGSARKPMRASGGRGQVLAKMIIKTGGRRGQTLAGKLGGTSIGRGQSAPSPPVRRPEDRGRHADTYTKASLPAPVTMHLDCQGPPVTYSKASSRSPQRAVASPQDLSMLTCELRWQPMRKKRRLLKPPLTRSRNRNGMNRLL